LAKFRTIWRLRLNIGADFTAEIEQRPPTFRLSTPKLHVEPKNERPCAPSSHQIVIKPPTKHRFQLILNAVQVGVKYSIRDQNAANHRA